MAPASAAIIRVSVTTSGWTMPLPMVWATATLKTKAAAKLKKAAQSTATRGESTRVATMVEMELAASFMPLRKSKSSAIAMMKMTIHMEKNPSSGVGQNDKRRKPKRQGKNEPGERKNREMLSSLFRSGNVTKIGQ